MGDLWLVPRVLGGLAVVGLLLAALAFGLRQLEARPLGRRSGAGRRLRLVETLWVAPAAALLVVSAGGRLLLLSRSAGQLALLCELPPEVPHDDAHPRR